MTIERKDVARVIEWALYVAVLAALWAFLWGEPREMARLRRDVDALTLRVQTLEERR